MPVEIYIPQIKSAEKAVMYAKTELLKQFKGQIRDIELVRSFHAGEDKWYDWTKEKTISLRIIGISGINSELENLQSTIFKKYGVKLKLKTSEI